MTITVEQVKLMLTSSNNNRHPCRFSGNIIQLPFSKCLKLLTDSAVSDLDTDLIGPP